MSRRAKLLLIAGLVVGGVLAWLFWPMPAPAPATNAADLDDPAVIARGSYLARAGNCIACHSAAGAPDYAGGRVIETPFGGVYSSNLTPDPATGLGAWTAEDFWQAMHLGRARDGRLLYPAFPYPNYTHLTREDSDAIYAFLRTLAPVERARPAHTLRFPYSSQFALRIWRRLYFRPGPLPAAGQRSAEWLRGRYLVEGPGHCDACHTARGPLGGLREDASYGGGPIPMLGWDALPLALPGPISDAEADDLVHLLKTGVSARDAVAGPMAEVVFHSLQYLDRADLESMVVYLRSLPPAAPRAARRGPRVSEQTRARLLAQGEVLYAEHCSDCHGSEGEGQPYVYPALAGNRSLNQDSPVNALQLIRFGGFAPSTAGNPQPHGMPPYQHQLSDAEIAAVLSYVRSAWGNAARPVSAAEAARR